MPPFNFQRTTARVFPLRANLGQLSRFIDQYLNIAAPEIGVFFPALPYVFLAILDYGKMASNEVDAGWIAQNEFSFFVPLEWHQRQGGRDVFRDWIVVAPFIFVDNELSLQMGREVYGWEKILAKSVSQRGDRLVSDPHADAKLLEVSTLVWAEALTSRKPEVRPILGIKRKAAPFAAEVPPRLRSPWNPLFSVPRAAAGLSSLGVSVAEILGRSNLSGYRAPSDLTTLTSLMQRLAHTGKRFVRERPYVNILSLKQFRDSNQPEFASYQSLVYSQMTVEQVNRFGSLDDVFFAAGDLSAGYRIELSSYHSQQIVETLGLVPSRTLDGGDHTLYSLEPVLPFWMDVHLRYDRGEPLAWRGKGTKWTKPQTVDSVASGGLWRPEFARRSGRGSRGAAGDEASPGASHQDAPESGALPAYNASLSNSNPAMLGPFDFPETTVRVLPLLADPEVLSDFVKRYMNIQSPSEGEAGDWCDFEAWGRYVYLMIWNHEAVHSRMYSFGSWARYSVEFAVPVRCFRHRKKKGRSVKKLHSVGLITPYVFSDRSLSAMAQRETLGTPAQRADIEPSDVAWMETAGPGPISSSLVTLSTRVQPGPGHRIEFRRLLEVTRDQPLPYNDDVRWRFVVWNWLEPLAKELGRKAKAVEKKPKHHERLRALAVELLTGREPINYFTLKQIRSAEEPQLACFQSFSHYRRQIQEVYDLREIESTLHVKLFNFYDLPIAKTLGLIAKTPGRDDSQIFQPVRPFWMKIQMRETLCGDLLWRSRERWGGFDPKDRGFFNWKGELEMDSGVVDRIDAVRSRIGRKGQAGGWPDLSSFRQRPKQALRGRAKEWSQKPKRKKRISRKQARRAVLKSEPQSVVESTLSRQWLDWGNPRWYRSYRRKPDFCIPGHTIGHGGVRDFFGIGAEGDWLCHEPGGEYLQVDVWKEDEAEALEEL